MKIIIKNNRGLQTIQKTEIQELKVKKFSVLKTATGIVSTYFLLLIAGIAIIAIIAV